MPASYLERLAGSDDGGIVKRLCIIGMGRVGLTLSLVLADVGFEVLGVERDQSIVASLNRGQTHFYEKGLGILLKKHLQKNLVITTKVADHRWDAYIICVATPIERESKQPVLDHVLRAAREVAGHLKEGDLVVLRSTVPVGTTRSVVLPLLQERQEHIYLAFCPERTVEGKALTELRGLPQIVGGLDEESVEKAVAIFSRVTPTTVRVSSLEAAEMIKLLDNTYRDINFAYANEVALIAEGLGLDAIELIRAANLGYTRNNIPMPGPVGGACLSKDPYVLNASAAGRHQSRLSRVAREVNEYLPRHIAQKLQTRLASVGKDLSGAKVLIAGIAFKGHPETDDLRDSPALGLIDYLKKEYDCQRLYGHDFVVPAEEIRKIGVEPCSLDEGLKGADGVLFLNNHSRYYDVDVGQVVSQLNKPAVFIDCWHIFEPQAIKQFEGILYGGLGVD